VAALEALGLTYALAGAYREQLEVDREAIRLRPRAKAPRRRLVYALLRTGRSEEALRAAQELVALDPSDTRSAEFLNVSQQVLRGARDLQRGGPPRSVPLDAWINILPLVGD
jgi:tetratricopeptide (TPR) repeat protein